ncbi:glycine cleavage system protein GcvH [Actinoplanes sp. NPDC048796]|uniref:glycine cleavage system protein GcvH n=1 Tax=Actinoplanes sp. NPDC048796 TaxID=3155640 RepID=UPI0033EDD052
MTGESYPADLRYHRQHNWARIEDDTATFGITWFAQDNLQEIVYFDARAVGDAVARDEPYGEIESVKAVSDVDAPLSGVILEVNTALADGAAALNQDPYGRGWTVKVRLSDPDEAGLLLTADEYQTTISR